MDHFTFSTIEVIFYIFGGLYYSIIFCLGFFLIHDDFKLTNYYIGIIATIFMSMVFGIAELVNAESIENIYNSIACFSYSISTSIITIWITRLLAKYNSDCCK